MIVGGWGGLGRWGATSGGPYLPVLIEFSAVELGVSLQDALHDRLQWSGACDRAQLQGRRADRPTGPAGPRGEQGRKAARAWFSRAIRSYSCLRTFIFSEVTVTCESQRERLQSRARRRCMWHVACACACACDGHTQTCRHAGACLVRLVRGLGVHDRVHLAEQDLILPLDRKIALRLHLAREEWGRRLSECSWQASGAEGGGGSGEAARRGYGLTCMRFALYCTCGYCLGERMSIPGFILRNLSTCASWPRCSSRSAVALLLTRICWVDVGSGYVRNFFGLPVDICEREFDMLGTAIAPAVGPRLKRSRRGANGERFAGLAFHNRAPLLVTTPTSYRALNHETYKYFAKLTKFAEGNSKVTFSDSRQQPSEA